MQPPAPQKHGCHHLCSRQTIFQMLMDFNQACSQMNLTADVNVKHVQRSDPCVASVWSTPSCLHPVHYMMGGFSYFSALRLWCNESFQWCLIGIAEKKKTDSHLVFFYLFFCRLQQQRSEDGLQATRALRQLQRAGLAGNRWFLSSNASRTVLVGQMWD